MLLHGMENDEIAAKMGREVRTVKSYFNQLYRRFEIRNGIKRVKLAVFLYRHIRNGGKL